MQVLSTQVNITQIKSINIGIMLPKQVDNMVAKFGWRGQIWSNLSELVPGVRTKINNFIYNSKTSINSYFSRLTPEDDRAILDEKRLKYTSKHISINSLVSIEFWLKKLNQGKIYLYQGSQRLRDDIVSIISRNYDQNISNIIIKLMIGSTQKSNSEIDHLLKITGTQHLFVISGFHLSFVIALFSKIYKGFMSKWLTVMTNSMISLLYLLVVGASFSLVRASLMLFFSGLVSGVFLRKYTSLFGLFLAFALIILTDISAINSISFQLSFAATFGIILLTITKKNKSFLTNIYLSEHDFSSQKNDKKTDMSEIYSNIRLYFFESIQIGLAAQIAVFPLVMYHFDQINPLSFVISALVAWIVPVILSLSFIIFAILILFPSSLNFEFLILLPLRFVGEILHLMLEFFAIERLIFKFESFSVPMIFGWYAFFFFLYLIFFVVTKSKQKQNYEKIITFNF
jgi:ComEC/Rec2-related protein